MALITIDDSVLFAKDAEIAALTQQVSRLSGLLNRATTRLAKLTSSAKLQPEQGDGNQALQIKKAIAEKKIEQATAVGTKAQTELAEAQATLAAIDAALGVL